MRFRVVLALLAIVLLNNRGFTQALKKDKVPAKGKKIDSLPGFRKFTIHGFTVMVRDDVLKEQDNASHKRKPLEALELELKLIAKVMTKTQADTIRRNVQVWVEWDVKEAVRNGRTGTTLGYYMGTEPRPIQIGKESIEVSGVRILQMQSITKRHQSDEAHDSVLLHEFAHAFHDLVLDFDHEPIKKAYQQAMERKLYDKSTYLTTNEKEFFAELTCAYLDKLDYAPHNRQELKKHDPITFRLLESIWGRRKNEKITAKEQPKYSLDISLTGLKLGKPLSGPLLVNDDLKGRVVLISYWEPSRDDVGPSLQKMQKWQNELGDYGLVVVSEASWGELGAVPLANDEVAQESIRLSGTTLSHFFNGTLEGLEDFELYPHAVVFDSSGKCLYRGDVFGAEVLVRSAVGKALVAQTGIEKFTPALTPFVEALQKGSPPSRNAAKDYRFLSRRNRRNGGTSQDRYQATDRGRAKALR